MAFRPNTRHWPASGTALHPEFSSLDARAYFLAENAHGRYAVPHAFADREVPRILARGEVYEPGTLRMMMGMAGTGDIVSGGAFVGDFFPALANALAPGRLLHSFEPAPLTYGAAQQTIALNRLRNVRLHQVAVSDQPGKLPLLTARREGGNPLAAAARLVPGLKGGHVTRVDVTTIDRLVPDDRMVSVLHLDIEGYEMQALRGAAGVIARCRPTIIIEAENRRKQRLCKRALRTIAPNARYHILDSLERNIVLAPLA